jgi:DNA-binding transcriptional MerR regulator
MTELPTDLVIPDRPTFKAAEVCELLKLQPYVLRSWENEFKDLGVARAPGGPRVYRRADVERAFRIRQLVFGEGLTLAGVRRRLEHEQPEVHDVEEEPPVAAPPARAVDPAVGARIERARRDLRGLLAMLGSQGQPGGPRVAGEGPHAEKSAQWGAAPGSGSLLPTEPPPVSPTPNSPTSSATGPLFGLDGGETPAESAPAEAAAPSRRGARRRKADTPA